MAYTEIDDPSVYFQIKLYTAADAYTFDGNSDMQPDWMWIKERNGTNEHNLFDSVRGTTKRLESSTTAAEQTSSTTLTAFGSDGFTVGNNGGTGQNGGNYVGWGWKAGTSFSNSAGANGASIASSGSTNTTSRFSICKWIPTDTSTPETIFHGLGVKPDLIIIKNRDRVTDWAVYSSAVDANFGLKLNTTATKSDDNGFWEDTEPTSAIFTTGNGAGYSTGAATQNFIAYCFASKQGYSKFGSYKGNDNADGTFVYLGFSPAWVMIKRIDSVNDWIILDNKRNPINPSNERILANTNAAASTANTMVDFLSNGFKPRSTYGGINSANNFIYMAFAEQPFVTSTGVPATAR